MQKILLVGGNGFLGKGLYLFFSLTNNAVDVIDIDDIDISNSLYIEKLSNIFDRYDNIIILASKIGAKLFEADALNAANYNATLDLNILKAIKLSLKKYNTTFDITYYSTSEVFNSQKDIETYITDNTEYSFDYNNLRYLYSYNKWKAELEYFKLLAEYPNIVSSVKIVRPFNIYGRNQQRGVVYDMIKTALVENIIYYSDDTTRTMTDIDFASKMSTDAILSKENLKLNVVDSRNSLTMEALAHIINDVLNANCKYIKMQPDHYIRYRTTSKVNANLALTKLIMTPHILELAELIKQQL